jgi:hypothetical protein
MAETPSSGRWGSSLSLVAAGAAVVGVLVAYYSFSYIPSRERYFVESHLRELVVLAGQIEGAIATQITSAEGTIDDLTTYYPGRTKAGDEIVIGKLKRANLTWAACDSAKADKEGAPTTPAGGSPGQASAVTVHFKAGAALVSDETSPFVGRTDTAPGWATTSRDSTLSFEPSGGGSICPTRRLSEIVEPLLQADQRDVQDVFVAQGEKVLFQRGRRDLRITIAKLLAPTPLSGEVKADEKKPPPPEIWTSSASMDVVLGGQVFKVFVQPVQIENLPQRLGVSPSHGQARTECSRRNGRAAT